MSTGPTPETPESPSTPELPLELPLGELVDAPPRPLPRPPRPPRPRYRLLWFQLVPLALLLAVEFFFQLPLAHAHGGYRTGQVVPFMVGHILGMLLFPVLVSWIAFLLFRRSELVANISFTLILLFMVLASYAQSRETSQQIAHELFDAERNQLAAKERDARDAAHRFSLSMQFNDRLAPTATDRAANVLQAMHRFDEMIQQNDDLKTSTRQARGHLDAQLKDEGVMAGVRARALDALDEYIQLDRFESNCAASDRFYQALRKSIDFLHDHYGEWSIPATEGRVRFNSDATQQEYNRLTAATEAALAVVRERERELEATTRRAASETSGKNEAGGTSGTSP